MGRYGGVFLLQGGEFQRPWKRCSIIAKCVLEVEIAMGILPVPIYVSSRCFALRYEVPVFLPSGGHICMAMLTPAPHSIDFSRSRVRAVELCKLNSAQNTRTNKYTRMHENS